MKARFWFLTLSFYAILRSIPDKVGGVSAMVGALLVLFIIPFNVETVITENIKIELTWAGHILGASSIQISYKTGDGKNKKRQNLRAYC